MSGIGRTLARRCSSEPERTKSLALSCGAESLIETDEFQGARLGLAGDEGRGKLEGIAGPQRVDPEEALSGAPHHLGGRSPCHE